MRPKECPSPQARLVILAVSVQVFPLEVRDAVAGNVLDLGVEDLGHPCLQLVRRVVSETVACICVKNLVSS